MKAHKNSFDIAPPPSFLHFLPFFLARWDLSERKWKNPTPSKQRISRAGADFSGIAVVQPHTLIPHPQCCHKSYSPPDNNSNRPLPRGIMTSGWTPIYTIFFARKRRALRAPKKCPTSNRGNAGSSPRTEKAPARQQFSEYGPLRAFSLLPPERALCCLWLTRPAHGLAQANCDLC